MSEEPSDEFKKQLKWHLEEGYVKVGVRCRDAGREWLWCKPVDNKLLEVSNTPFFVDEPSRGDIIEVTGDGPWYDFAKVVEHVTEPVYLEYEVDVSQEEMLQRYKVFGKAIAEHEFACEGPAIGYVVVSVPWGKREESIEVILAASRTAKMKMSLYEQEQQGEPE